MGKKKHINFMDRSRNKRRDMVMRVKNDMRQNAGIYGGRFVSHQVIDDERPNTWLDSFFPHMKDPSIVYNVTIVTATQELWDLAEDYAINKVLKQVEEIGGDPYEDALKFERDPDEASSGGMKLYRIKTLPQRRYDEFDGRTKNEQIDFETEAYIATKPPIYEQARLDFDYAFGIGLDIVVDAHGINVDVVNEAIDKFYAHGCQDWTATEPCKKVNYQSRRDMIREICQPNQVRI